MEYWEESMGANTLQTVLDENEDLKQQLAKANERVRELEKELDIAIECIEDSGIDYEEATEQLRKEQE